jgi:hypothetical protein
MGSSSNRSADYNLNSLRSTPSRLDADEGKRARVTLREGGGMPHGIGMGNAISGSLRPEKVSHKASASHDKTGVVKDKVGMKGGGGSSGSNDSRQMIIKKKMAWSVERG